MEFRLIHYHSRVEESLKVSLLQHDFIRWTYLIQVAASKGAVPPDKLKEAVSGVQKEFSTILNDYLHPINKKHKKVEEERKRLSDQDKMAFLAEASDKPFNSLDEILTSLQKIKI